MKKNTTRFFTFLMAMCMLFVTATTAFAAEPAGNSMVGCIEVPSLVSENGVMPLSTDLFEVYGSKTFSFFDCAYIHVHNVLPSKTIKVTLSGHPSTEYLVWFRNTDTSKYINGDGSSCSKYTLFGGDIYISISPYNGGSNWVTATVEVV